MTYEPGEGPITEEEAKVAVAADEAADDDTEPPEEPLEGGMPPEALAEASDGEVEPEEAE